MKMPRNKRESLIYSIIMCFTMVLWMSMYNVTLHMGHLSLETIREGWIGFPFAFVYAFLFDWFIVSGPAKGIAFRYFVSPESSTLRKVITISCCMVVPMVFVMSLYGGLEACVKSGALNQLLIIWLTNIPKNIIMALTTPMGIISIPTVTMRIPAVVPDQERLHFAAHPPTQEPDLRGRFPCPTILRSRRKRILPSFSNGRSR